MCTHCSVTVTTKTCTGLLNSQNIFTKETRMCQQSRFFFLSILRHPLVEIFFQILPLPSLTSHCLALYYIQKNFFCLARSLREKHMSSSLGLHCGHLSSVVFHTYYHYRNTLSNNTVLSSDQQACTHCQGTRHPLQLLSNQLPSSCLVCRFRLQFTSMPSPHTICMQRVPEYSTGNFDLLHTNFKSVIRDQKYGLHVCSLHQMCSAQNAMVYHADLPGSETENCSSRALRW